MFMDNREPVVICAMATQDCSPGRELIVQLLHDGCEKLSGEGAPSFISAWPWTRMVTRRRSPFSQRIPQMPEFVLSMTGRSYDWRACDSS